MDIRWYLCRVARASQVIGGPARGFVPSFWEFVTSQTGMTTGNLPVHGCGLALAAISLDERVMSRTDRTAVWSALEVAPDIRVFDIRETMSSLSSSWPRRGSLFAALEVNLIDTGARMSDPGVDIRQVFREIARTLMFYRFLGRAFYPLHLDQQLNVISNPGLKAMGDQMVEHGWPSAKIPNATVTFRDFYRAALNDPLTDYGIDSGKFHLGLKEANLGGQ